MSDVAADVRRIGGKDRLIAEKKENISSIIDESNKSQGSSQRSDEKRSANQPNLPNIANASSNYGFRVGQFPDMRPSPSRSSKKQSFIHGENPNLIDRQFKSEIVFATPQLSHRRLGGHGEVDFINNAIDFQPFRR